MLKNDKYMEMAKRAYDYLIDYFWDKEYGGLYWMLDHKGNPINSRKQIYAQAFGIYAFTEYYRATGKEESLAYALKLFDLIERYSYDPENKGYFEAYKRQWELEDDLRLSEKDMNEKKTMNTHLHIMEAYTTLLKAKNIDTVRVKLRELIELTVEKIINGQTGHFERFFDEFWKVKSAPISYGHDIEGSWLLYEAAQIVDDDMLIKKVKDIAIFMAKQTLEQGIDVDGGLYNEGEKTNIIDPDKYWWPQAEAAVGFLNAYQLTSEEHYFYAFCKVWDFIDRYIVDKENGEWFARVSKVGEVYMHDAKVEQWKCPYHNSRACLEISERLQQIVKTYVI